MGAYAAGNACDCTAARCGSGNTPSSGCAGGFNANTCECPPLCGDGTTNPYTTQVNAKAYPSPREIEEVKLMGTQGILSSLCPIHTTCAAMSGTNCTDPLYGYNPAVNAIIQRLKNALANQCLPQKLTPDNCGTVECLVLETLPASDIGKPCSDFAANGLTGPQTAADQQVLAQFQQTQHTEWAENGGVDAGLGPDPSTLTTCWVTQLVTQPAGLDPSDQMSCQSGSMEGHYSYVTDITAGTCAASTEAGWCYVSGAATGGGCPQALLFSMPGSPLTGATVSLQCIESTSGVDAGPSNMSGGGG
jgi:hypothetical protein